MALRGFFWSANSCIVGRNNAIIVVPNKFDKLPQSCHTHHSGIPSGLYNMEITDMPQRLTFPAPLRDQFKTRNGWYSHPWSTTSVKMCLSAGGWFQRGLAYDFDSKAARDAAFPKLNLDAVSFTQ